MFGEMLKTSDSAIGHSNLFLMYHASTSGHGVFSNLSLVDLVQTGLSLVKRFSTGHN